MVEDLTAALTAGIDELTRPVDAIKHQAKTVTVGISRSDEELLQVAARAARCWRPAPPATALSYRALRTLAALDPAVERGHRLHPLPHRGRRRRRRRHHPRRRPRRHRRSTCRSRTDDDPRLRGTKHRVATEREVTVAAGRSDGRTVIIVPEVKDNQTVGHHAAARRASPTACPADVARSVLQGYRGRYAALRDAVTETEPTFDDDRAGRRSTVVDLLTEPVYVLADRWR